MITAATDTTAKVVGATPSVQVRVLHGAELNAAIPQIASAAQAAGWTELHRHPNWLLVLKHGLRQDPYLLSATRGDRLVGYLPLSFVSSWLFGRFLVSLPYLNTGGVTAQDDAVAEVLVNHAVGLADVLDVRYLELRHERQLSHPALPQLLTNKVHMRRALPSTIEELWQQLDPKVRNQIRKGEEHQLSVHWGAAELLSEFYEVFSRNMRDLGTPTFSRRLFAAILQYFPDSAELCVVRAGSRAIAAAMLLHGSNTTQVPSASSLRQFNGLNANMLMYWHLLQRAIQRRQATFDFGRSSPDSGTFRFKKQWDAMPEPAVWQYYVRQGSVGDMRPDNPRYARLIRAWRRLPVWATRLVGPSIVRGIP